MTRSMRSLTAALTAITIGAAGLTGCATVEGLNNKERGVLIGAATGAAAGGVIGNNTGSTARGAILGAIVGGAAGAIIGHQMDKQAEKLEREIPGADVNRVGEGIAVTFPSGILFPFDSDVLKPESRQNLQSLARNLQENPGTEVLIVGHTDAKGSDDYNLRLSERRAASAARYLTSLGVDPARVRTTGRGELEPIATNETEEGRALNRRVEVAIFAGPELRQEAKQQAGARGY